MNLLILREPWFWILVVALAVGLFFPFSRINNRALRIACFFALTLILLLATAVVLNLILRTG